MSDPHETYDAPQDTGPPDPVETDPAALNSAEDLDEDRLHVDPLEAGMDPPRDDTGQHVRAAGRLHAAVNPSPARAEIGPSRRPPEPDEGRLRMRTLATP